MESTPQERLTVVASRLLRDGDVCFVGIGAPSAACNLARATHAPNLVLVYESGALRARPGVLPLSIGDGELSETALTTVGVVELFQYWLQGGRISKGFLGGAQIDRFGNVNSTVIGPYDAPSVRLPGAGGAPEIAACCGEVVLTAHHSTRTFVDRLDFVTTFGHGRGTRDRMRHGLATAGPTTVVTDLCVLAPDPVSGELVVDGLQAGVTEARVRDATGWPVRFAERLTPVPAPTVDELAALRELVARTEQARAEGDPP